MTITSVIIGQRLRTAREGRKITQEEAATALNLQRSAISLMESGQRQVSTLELTRMADLYGRPISWFVNPKALNEFDDPVVALFRADQGLKSDYVRNQADRCLHLIREGASLLRFLGREDAAMLPRYDLPEAQSVGLAISQGHQVASEERRRLRLGVAPISSLPQLISAQGIWTTGLELPDEISGLFLKSPDFGMAILVNTKQSPVRRRFSYAHEFGHALMDRDEAATVSSIHNSKSRPEQRANAFAAAFLMPRAGVRSFLSKLGKGKGSRREEATIDEATGEGIRGELRTPPRSQNITYADLALMARHFGVSYLAAVWRLRGLNAVTVRETEALLEKTGDANRYLRAVRDFSDMDDPNSFAPAEDHHDHELDRQIMPLALEAWRRGEISESRLLEFGRLFAIDEDTVLKIADAARDR